jgi:hypothetical protein
MKNGIKIQRNNKENAIDNPRVLLKKSLKMAPV